MSPSLFYRTVDFGRIAYGAPLPLLTKKTCDVRTFYVEEASTSFTVVIHGAVDILIKFM